MNCKSHFLFSFVVFDSSAKIGSGLLTGHTKFVGNYDECLKINIQRNGNQIKGQYCTAIISPSTTISECINQEFVSINLCICSFISIFTQCMFF